MGSLTKRSGIYHFPDRALVPKDLLNAFEEIADKVDYSVFVFGHDGRDLCDAITDEIEAVGILVYKR